MSEFVAEYALAISCGVIVVPLKDIEALDNRSLETGCRPYLCGDYDLSILELGAKREKENES